MTILHLYTSTSGRISRKTWWLGAIGLTIIYLIARQLLGLIVQYEPAPIKTGEGVTAYLSWATDNSLWWHSTASLIWSVAFSALVYCLSVKRRHDRNGNGWDIALVLVLPILLGLFGLIQSLLPSPPPRSGPNEGALWVFLLAGYIYQPFAIYVLVMLGLVKGSKHDNDYGPSPLPAPAAPATN